MKSLSCYLHEHNREPRECYTGRASITSHLVRGDCAKRMDMRCHPPENLRVYTHVPVPLLDYIQRLCSGCHNSMLDRGAGMSMTGHGLFANVGSAERTDSVSARTRAQGGGSTVAFYEPPTSELGQPRPRVSRNYGNARDSGSLRNPRN